MILGKQSAEVAKLSRRIKSLKIDREYFRDKGSMDRVQEIQAKISKLYTEISKLDRL